MSSQLWKISFSALVYGGLVLVCLGGVVWGISFAVPDIFPIHWSSDEPVLEFPVDLLFYNFLMPMAIKLIKPSLGLSKIYKWWFHRCARALRLSSFLFKERHDDEEGRHVRRTWTDVLRGKRGDVHRPVIGHDRELLAQDRNVPAYFLRDGRFVRAPAMDQVRIPKGVPTFLEVDDQNRRVDGAEDEEGGLHGRSAKAFQMVYIPPLFRLRIAALIAFIWLFAASTGVSVTIIPLLFGRWVFARLTPDHLRMNDIYAFSIGIYVLGSTAYALVNHTHVTTFIKTNILPKFTTVGSILHRSFEVCIRALRILYTYSAFGIFLPFLFSLLLEFYIIIPLHTYLTNNPAYSGPAGHSLASTSQPIIHLIQDWTLGVLYVKMLARFILWTTPSRPARAMRAIVSNGWLNPDIRLATRGFIFPATLVMAIVLAVPLSLGWVVNHTAFRGYSEDDTYFRACVYRYSYPAVMMTACAAGILWLICKAFSKWRRRVRDEVYLIGERLHNFGEGKRRAGLSKVKAGKAAIRRN